MEVHVFIPYMYVKEMIDIRGIPEDEHKASSVASGCGMVGGVHCRVANV